MDRRLWGFAFMDNTGYFVLDTKESGVSAQLLCMQKKGTSRGEKIVVKGPKFNELF